MWPQTGTYCVAYNTWILPTLPEPYAKIGQLNAVNGQNACDIYIYIIGLCSSSNISVESIHARKYLSITFACILQRKILSRYTVLVRAFYAFFILIYAACPTCIIFELVLYFTLCVWRNQISSGVPVFSHPLEHVCGQPYIHISWYGDLLAYFCILFVFVHFWSCLIFTQF